VAEETCSTVVTDKQFPQETFSDTKFSNHRNKHTGSIHSQMSQLFFCIFLGPAQLQQWIVSTGLQL